MRTLPESHKLLDSVANRLRFVRLGRMWRRLFIAVCGAYLIVVLTSRLTGWGDGQFMLIHLPLLAVLTLALALIIHRKPTRTDAARLIDDFAQTRDLFLTLTMLESSAGEFQALVAQSAEAQAAPLRRRAIVQFPWQKPSLQVATTALLLWAAVTQFPQLDPFGKIAQARESEKQISDLAQSRVATKTRLEELKAAREDSKLAGEVSKALEKLKQTFGKLDQSKPAENRDSLGSEQKHLGALWKKLQADQTLQMLKKAEAVQAFGEPGSETMQKWAKELADGNAQALRKELQELQDLAQKLEKSTDPIEKAALQQELKKRTQQMKQFAAEKLQNKALKTALDRALAQLESSKQESLEREALDAVKESLELATKELQQVEMSAQDMKALEEALQAIQMAKKLNEAGDLQGEGGEEFGSIEEYREYYEELMAGADGEGMDGQPGDGGGEGQGEPEAEDDSIETGFKPEQSKSAVQAGRMLMSINTKGLPPEGAKAEEVKTRYRDLVQTVKSTAEEAIQQEQIPPGYHDGIKQYFNSLEEKPAGQ